MYIARTQATNPLLLTIKPYTVDTWYCNYFTSRCADKVTLPAKFAINDIACLSELFRFCFFTKI